MKHCTTCNRDVRPVAQLDPARGVVECCPGCAGIFGMATPTGQLPAIRGNEISGVASMQPLAVTNPAVNILRITPAPIVEQLLAREAELVAKMGELEAAKRELRQVRRMLKAAGPDVVNRAKVVPLRAAK